MQGKYDCIAEEVSFWKSGACPVTTNVICKLKPSLKCRFKIISGSKGTVCLPCAASPSYITSRFPKLPIVGQRTVSRDQTPILLPVVAIFIVGKK